MKPLSNVLGLLAAIGLGGLISTASAQDGYPDRPISVAACYPAGGGVDRNLRMVERVAAKYLGQSLLPQYRTGGSGTVAMQYIKDAEPNGYELAICDNGGAIIAPIAQGLDLDADDFTPIVQVSFVPWIMTTRASSPYDSVDAFIEAAKASESPIAIEISDIATSDHYGWLLLLKEAGLSPDKFKWNPHGGGGPKMRAIIAGEGDFLFDDAGEISGYVDNGTLRPLAVASSSRLPQFPDVPTMRELGYDVIAGSSVAMYAPPGLSDDKVEALQAAMREIKQDPALLKAFELTLQDPDTFIVDEFEAMWRKDWSNAAELLKAALGG
ncbi:MAG: tripartite tricarboxylate transporter substrate binding protein [Rhodobacteraceae bacterium]|nr:tripartite tricarboxylate transporter substrate binding protein [Paracoccaceae bacterium]